MDQILDLLLSQDQRATSNSQQQVIEQSKRNMARSNLAITNCTNLDNLNITAISSSSSSGIINTTTYTMTPTRPPDKPSSLVEPFVVQADVAAAPSGSAADDNQQQVDHNLLVADQPLSSRFQLTNNRISRSETFN